MKYIRVFKKVPLSLTVSTKDALLLSLLSSVLQGHISQDKIPFCLASTIND